MLQPATAEEGQGIYPSADVLRLSFTVPRFEQIAASRRQRSASSRSSRSSTVRRPEKSLKRKPDSASWTSPSET